ncbi:Probable pectinesterase/pectinesterase inhibitor 13 [Linum grandiflorum]
MVFQDFDQITERRRLERQRQFRKKLIIASVVAIICISLIVACAYAFVGQELKNNKNKDVDDHKKSTTTSDGDESAPKKSTKSDPQDDKENSDDEKPTKGISAVQKMVKTVCNSSTYQTKCQTTYEDAIKKNSSVTANDFIKISIQAVSTEIQSVMTKIQNMKFDDPKAQGAFEDCKKLIEDAKDELNFSISTAGEYLKNMARNEPELRNWLSAVMSYQQTCIDGFPDGKAKTEMEKSFNASKEFTSNSLAVVATSESLLAAIAHIHTGRRLLGKERSLDEDHDDEFPGWVSHEDRRMLKGASTGDKPKPNKVVAKDGSGDFKTISEAIKAIPEKYDGRYVIYVKQGVYDETVTIEKRMENITMYGDGSQKSIVTGSKNFADGVRTLQTATFVVLANGFVSQAMGFRNTAGPSKHQAVAMRVQGDKAVFINSRFEGYQDTLYAQNHRHFYKSCVISGTIDFIFGDAAAVFQNCLILLRKPMDDQQNTITAQGRMDKYQSTGFVLQNCRIEADKDLTGPAKDKVKSYLGRPWRDYSRTVVMESTLDLIQPEGWLAWEGEKGLKTLYYAEYGNKGPDAGTDKRVKWAGFHVINKDEAMKFTVVPFIQGDEWVDEAGAQVKVGLFS